MHTSVIPLAHTKAETTFPVDPTFWNENDNQQFWSDNDDDLFWDDTTAQVTKSQARLHAHKAFEARS